MKLIAPIPLLVQLAILAAPLPSLAAPADQPDAKHETAAQQTHDKAAHDKHAPEKHTAEKHPPEKHAAEKHGAEKHGPEKHPAEKHAAEKHTAKPAAKAEDKPEPAADGKPDAKAPAKAEDDPHKGGSTGLPLPRFAALKSDEVYLRVGPGTRYPIEWVYKRRDLPVEIIREFDVWRLVVDHDGVKGWVHQATLTGRRAFQVVGDAVQVMRGGPDETAPAVAKLKPGVIGRLRGCEAKAAWCKVQIGDYRGWLSRDAFWGIEPDEAIQ